MARIASGEIDTQEKRKKLLYGYGEELKGKYVGFQQEFKAYRRVSRSVEGTAKIFACYVFGLGEPARPRKTRTA